jgi:hypothetical protein
MKSLVFMSENDRYNSYLEVFGAMVDESGKSIDEKLTFLNRLRIEAKMWNPDTLRQGKDIQSEAVMSSLAPGEYQLVVGVRQMPSGRIATKKFEISIN